MMKVLIIGPFPDPISGVSIANKVLKEVLTKHNKYRVSIINTSYNKFEDKLGQFSIKKLFFFIVINFKIFKILLNDVIYITPGQTFYGVLKYSLVILFSKILNKKLMVHVHGNRLVDEYEELKGVKKNIFKFLLSKTDKGIVLSDSLKRNMTSFIPEKSIFVLPNFAQDYLVCEIENKNYNTLRLVYLSNLMIEKGILDVLDALVILEEKGIKYEAQIAGNVDFKNKDLIEQKIKKLKNTKYVGVVTGKKKSKLLSWANVFLLPTYYKMEGQPISIIEAMASGCVIMTTPHAGIPDIIKENEHGFFVKKMNPESIVSTLSKLTSSVMCKIGSNNQLYFKKNFTINIFKINFIKILED